jgi:replication factor A1
MEPDKLPKELTKDLLTNLARGGDATDGGNRVFGFLQIIKVKEDSSQIELSDGYCSFEVLVFKTLRPKIQTEAKLYDVIWAGVLKHKEAVYVLFEVSVVLKNITDLIGRPVSFDEYKRKGFHNMAGSCLIPLSVTAGTESHKIVSKVEEEDEDYTPISLLTVGSNSWAIKARIVSKSEIKSIPSKVSGREATTLFNLTLIDKSGKVSATFFKEAAQKFYDYLEVGKVYIFTNGEVRRRTNFTSNNSAVEITFSPRSDIAKCSSDGAVPLEYYEFKRCSDIQALENGIFCDLVGIILDIETESSIMTKKGEPLAKQVLKVGDDSMTEIELTFWGNQTSLLRNLKKGDLALFTSLRVSEFKGKSLNTSQDTVITTKMPDHHRVKEVIVWRNQKEKAGGISSTNFASLKTGGDSKEAIIVTISNYKRIASELGSNTAMGEKFPVFTVIGWLSMLPVGVTPDGIKSLGGNYFYNKCPNDKCYKKAEYDENDPNRCVCSSCGVLNKPPVPKFIGTFRIADTTDQLYTKMSGDYVGSALYGKSCQQLREAESIDRDDFVRYCYDRCNHLYYFRITPKMESYGGEIKVAHNCLSCYPVTGKTAMLGCKNMLATIKLLQNKLVMD